MPPPVLLSEASQHHCREDTTMTTTKTIRIRPLFATGAVAAAATAAVNAVIFGLGRAAGVDYVVDSSTTIGVADVVSFTLMAFAVGLPPPPSPGGCDDPATGSCRWWAR